MSEDTVKDRLRRNLKNATKKKFLPLGEGESTEDEENESSRKGKHVRRTKSPINISDAETSQATPEATHKAAPEATQEEPPEGSSTANRRDLLLLDIANLPPGDLTTLQFYPSGCRILYNKIKTFLRKFRKNLKNYQYRKILIQKLALGY
ncbi:hypothetical protein C2G38_2203921 [Gigaspora rosea]|uniref:Uncharacterized protein n=1 Tax=Gigaspora rosea TaxID=44941 RepID=A0A397UR53_9GLOM|nr:hypothetical protein C2G38_2203921 [Gigaspora rosea]